MTAPASAALINLLGYITGAALYAMLLVMAYGLSATAGAFHFQQAIGPGIGAADPLSVGLLIGLWVATALVYPWLRRSVVRFVDAWLLRRVDYEALRVEIARRIANQVTAETRLDEVCERLKE